MKKMALVVIGLMAVAIVGGCGGGGSDADLIKEQKAAMSDFADAVESAQNADQAAAAIDQLTATMTSLRPRMEEMAKKYPGIKEGKDVPEEIQAELNDMDETVQKLMGAMMKIQQSFGQDPKVTEAMQKLQTSMQNM
ncbi:MAG TPA: hypothetical protein PK636_03425 [bacterium]|nr:hypothetical protein [bacterium]HPJ71716.1 hypothetical protein [bacterium]HPQ65404.1 hypothetical protein [bacterium]